MAHPVKHSWRNRPSILATAALTALALAAPTLAATASAATPSTTPRAAATPQPASTPVNRQNRLDPKGPIGWDSYRHLDRVDALTTGVQTQQYSSFDRTGGNDDGFGGTYSCLRTETDGCVIAERAGAGEIDSIWFTRDNGDITATGNIKIVLDGKTVLDAKIQDIVDGKLGAPFVYPFVANADQSSGGVFIKVPMTYRTSMKVTTEKNPIFDHVIYRSFADANGVNTFDPHYVPQDVIAASKTWGSKDPKPQPDNATTTAKTFSLRPGQSSRLADVKGSGELTALKLQIPQIVGPPVLPLISDDGRAFTGSSQFTVKIDLNNTGIKLKRRWDANSNHEHANIYVDGVKVGEWTPTEDTAGHWSYQTVTLPATATAGKSSITVKNVFVSASIDFNEFHYWVDSIVNGTDVRTDELNVGTSADAVASEQAHRYMIVGQTWTGTTNQTDAPPNPNDPKVLASNELLRDVKLRITFDGKKTVESPLGEFFGSGLTESAVKALYYHVDTSPGGWYTSWWPMPFASKATVALVNKTHQSINTGRSAITSTADKSIGKELGRSDARIGYFNATHHRGETVNGQDWTFLSTPGKGKFVGVSETMRGQITTGNLRAYLEGDERVSADGIRSPQMHGTGTEDFYEAGWYFNRNQFTGPTNGAPAMLTGSYGCQYQCDAPYRLMIGDSVSFDSGLTFTMEHGPVDDAQAEYSSTAYWYGSSAPAARVTDTVDVGNRASEKAHHYTDPNGSAPVTLTETFEGDHDDLPVTEDLRSETGKVSFTVAVDSRNEGVVLHRMSNQSNAYQSAAVTVNGRSGGTWLQPLANKTHQWLDDTFEIDPKLTDGQRILTVTLTPTSGSPAWSAASYQALSLGRSARDHRSPSAITGLVGAGTASNANQLSWKAATDDVAVDHYEVYASTNRHFSANSKTLVGTPALSSFTHTDLGLSQPWYYQVRAVDTSGNKGPLSKQVSATTGDMLRIEGERLLPPVSATAAVSAQGNCCGVTWSGNQQLWLQGVKAGDTATFSFSVPTAGSYDASGVMTKAPDYGIVQVSIDGKDLAAPIDNYQPAGVTIATQQLGAVALAAGKHTLTLTLTGRNPAATNYFAGLDVLVLALG
ncbi:MAG: DUF2961 domain-containing protein [Actinomycetota bacterium]|nr:DUF2961 domain-containing protein [Actinomycetota bacterium]